MGLLKQLSASQICEYQSTCSLPSLGTKNNYNAYLYIPVLIDIHYPLCFLLKVNFSLLIVFAAWNSNFFLFHHSSIPWIIIRIFQPPIYVQFIKFLNNVEKLNYSTSTCMEKFYSKSCLKYFFLQKGKNEKNK